MGQLAIDAPIEKMISEFMGSYGIQTIGINKYVNSNSDKEVSEIVFHNINDVEGEAEKYKVSFKLQNEGADTFQYFTEIEAQPNVKIALSDYAEQVEVSELETRLKDFFKLIKTRIEKAKQEQDVQSIRFVGNTFVLNKSTTFKVIADDGEGRLDIEILGGDGLQEAMLSAHGLLDGLYTGFIEVLEPR